MEIRTGGLDHSDVRALIRLHREEARASTPICNAHSLDETGLADPAVAFFAAWDGATLLGIGALRELEPGHGELNSMRTAPAALRRGVGRALLQHLIATARARGWRRLSLETGTAPMFGPANVMYEKAGFGDCAAFGGYPASPHNRFMTHGVVSRGGGSCQSCRKSREFDGVYREERSHAITCSRILLRDAIGGRVHVEKERRARMTPSGLVGQHKSAVHVLAQRRVSPA